MPLYTLEGLTPRIDAATCYVAPTATLIGDVVLGRDASVWWGAVLRADNERIELGEATNVQDNAVLHTDKGLRLVLGRGVTVGHRAVLHGCTVGDFSLVGIGATVLNRARIGRHCLVGAHALVTEDTEVPDGSLVLGSPARVVRALTPEQLAGLERSAETYVAQARRYRERLVRTAD
jgi:carbonic anhydrase/acetyltransferase-like protein (isoleucine patch superfamily)